MNFATMVDWLAPAKMSYACSATLLDHVSDLQLTEGQQAFLKEIPDFNFRESVRDFMTNQQFRRDFWVKGARMLNPLERADALREQRLMLVTHRPDVTLKVSGALGEAQMNESVYAPLLDVLADHQPRTVGELERLPELKMPFAKFVQCLVVLCGSGQVSPVQTDTKTAAARVTSDRLNHALLQRSRGSNDIGHLASPVTGGGIGVSRFSQLFLLAQRQGLKNPEEWARFALDLVLQLKQRLLKEGKPLDRPEDTFNELVGQAKAFAEKELPTLKALQIV